MKSNLFRFLLAAPLLGFSGEIHEARGTVDPSLDLTIGKTNQNVVLSWFGANGVTYQPETSLFLDSWTNSGPAIIGAGTILLITNPVAGQDFLFYQVKRLVSGADGSAVFDPATGVLTIIGDNLDNTFDVGSDIDGVGIILINDGAVPITGGVATTANTVLIQVFGRDGIDHLTINESNGPMPPAHLFGEGGNDVLTGGSAADVLAGGPGLDTLIGRGGNDRLYGEADNDTSSGTRRITTT